MSVKNGCDVWLVVAGLLCDVHALLYCRFPLAHCSSQDTKSTEWTIYNYKIILRPGLCHTYSHVYLGVGITDFDPPSSRRRQMGLCTQ
jgi:hypothetical protein